MVQDKKDRYNTALICSTIANFVPMRSKKGKIYKPQDFMPKEKKKPQSTKQMLAMVEALNKAFGGVDLRKKEVDDV